MENFIEYLSSPEAISSLFESYKPIIYTVCKEFFDLYKDLVNNDEYYDVLALGDWKRYSALHKAGFTEEQAMQIIITEKKTIKDYSNSISGASLKTKM